MGGYKNSITDTGELITLSTSDAERLRIDSSGQVNITGNLAVDTNTLYVDASNNRVGIGTSSPTKTLHINSGTANDVVLFESTDAGANLIIKDSTSTGLNIIGCVGDNLISYTNGTEAMRIDSSGQVNITGNLAVDTNTLFVNASANNVYVGKTSDAATTGITLSSLGYVRSFRAEAVSAIFHRGTSDGDVVLLKKDDVNHGSIGVAGGGITFGSGGTATERMRITSDGKVLFNTTAEPNGSSVYGSAFSPSTSDRSILRMATSNANASTLAIFYNPNGQVGSIVTNGSATSYSTSSDYRLKENVVEMIGALDRVDALKPSRFNFIADPEKTVDGFLAHEVAEVVPEAISGEKDAVEEYEVTPAVLDDEGNVIEEAVMGTRPVYQGIDQSKLVPLLVGAIQELRAEIEALKANNSLT